MANCRTLAVMAASLANGGRCPLTGRVVLKHETVKSTIQLLLSCGMYDFSGEFACTIGIPSKSGVSGAIFSSVPNVRHAAAASATWAARDAMHALTLLRGRRGRGGGADGVAR